MVGFASVCVRPHRPGFGELRRLLRSFHVSIADLGGTTGGLLGALASLSSARVRASRRCWLGRLSRFAKLPSVTPLCRVETSCRDGPYIRTGDKAPALQGDPLVRRG